MKRKAGRPALAIKTRSQGVRIQEAMYDRVKTIAECEGVTTGSLLRAIFEHAISTTETEEIKKMCTNLKKDTK